MLITKLITAAVILLSLVAQAIMDHFWNDRRTKRYRYIRNCFLVAAIIGAALNAVVLGLDELEKEHTASADRLHRTAFENQSLGALTPNIYVFLYENSKLICPRPDPTFPDKSFEFSMISQTGLGPEPLLGLFIENTNTFPIYDLQITLLNETPNVDNTKPMTDKFPKPSLSVPILYPNTSQLNTYATSTDLWTKGFQFMVNTRKGETKHDIVLALISNNWEYALFNVDTLNNKVVSKYASAHIPRDTNGNPAIEVITRSAVKPSVQPVSHP